MTESGSPANEHQGSSIMSAAATLERKGKKKKKSSALSKELRQAFENMPVALRDEVGEILQQVADLDSADIQKRYDIGIRLNTMIGDTSGKYGVDPSGSLADVLRLSKDSLKAMMKVASGFEQPDLNRLTKIVNPVTREKLRWNHIVFLSRVPDTNKAFALAERAIDRGWTTKDLGKAIMRESGGPKSGGGRKPKRHVSLDQSLGDVHNRTRNLANVAETVWLAPGGLLDQYREMSESPGWFPTEVLTRQVSEVRAELTRMQLHLNATIIAVLDVQSRTEAALNQSRRKIA